MRLMLTPQKLADVDSYNVVADLKGSELPDQVVIVSGHLDSWDLGTGAMGPLMMARELLWPCRQRS